MRYTISAIKNLLLTAVVLCLPYVSQSGQKDDLSRSNKNKKHLTKSHLLNGSAVPVFTNEDYSLRIATLNEASPLQLDFNDIVKRHIHVYSVRHRKKTARILGLSEIYFPIFEEYLDKYDLPLELKYIAVIESALDPKARSRSGATGLWQFMYHASRMFDLRISSYVDERMDPAKSTEAACKYLQYLYRVFGDWQLAIAAYNGGPGVVREAIKASGGKTNFWEISEFLPEQTRAYVPAFIAVNYVMSYNKEHNIDPENTKFSYLKLTNVIIKKPLSIKAVSQELNIPLADIRRLNPIYKLDFIPKSELPAKLSLPIDKIQEYSDKESILYTIPQTKILYHDIEKKMSSTQGKKCIVHVVKAGEFFHKIAIKYSCTSNNIKTWNNLKSDILQIGQKLKVWVPVSQSRRSSQIGLKSTT